MKEFLIKNLDNFISVANTIESSFKFYQVTIEKDKEILRAEIWLRTAIISWEGLGDEKVKKRLEDNGFSEAELRETRKLWLAELL
jgi:hypothetical protein